MNAYTISHLAGEAGVSIHVVRDYVLRGLLHPARRTASGYGLYDAQSLARLRFVRAAFEAGIGLNDLIRLCRELDSESDAAVDSLECLRSLIATRRASLAAVDEQLAGMICAARSATELESHHA
ncbi:MAG: mercuric resistance transcriptional repressor protein MerD [Paraburkholderia sp.]|uniref:mercuric resistance transcriptional repressor MerD n=1 Tax=Paraburkholderia sp. TaxID=1926495 RepID=UPI001219DCF1|nr:mercuric resistance transcriptional repressor MerD [Paraburkholderia sp.]TAM00972.1 MAG: mercuric resistance transcriptional repressor protein MerD [Paraburkholderia sp.]